MKIDQSFIAIYQAAVTRAGAVWDVSGPSERVRLIYVEMRKRDTAAVDAQAMARKARRRRRGKLSAVAVVVLLACGGAAWAHRPPPPDDDTICEAAEIQDADRCAEWIDDMGGRRAAARDADVDDGSDSADCDDDGDE